MTIYVHPNVTTAIEDAFKGWFLPSVLQGVAHSVGDVTCPGEFERVDMICGAIVVK